MTETMQKVKIVTEKEQLSGVPERVKEIIDNIKNATDVRIVVKWTQGEIPNIEYRIDEMVRGNW